MTHIVWLYLEKCKLNYFKISEKMEGNNAESNTRKIIRYAFMVS